MREMGAHGHGYTDRAENHRDQADHAEDAGRLIQAARQARIGLAKVGYLRLRQYAFEPRANFFDIGSIRVQGGKESVRRHDFPAATGPRFRVRGV